MMDDPEDKRGMLMLMSSMLEELGAEFEEENFPKVVTANLGTVDKLLRSFLKKDLMRPEDMGLVQLYIQRVGGTEGTIDYAIKRMHENMSECQLIDIAIGLMNLPKMENEENALKFIKKAEAHVLLTHSSIMKGRNLNGIMTLMVAFD
jgi:hypothetical protein